MTNDMTDRAARLAHQVHAGQPRKGTDLSYFDGHLRPVVELVAESGGSDIQVAAAYLHDAAEDAGGPAMLDRIADEFGPDVAAIVEHLSDSVLDTTTGAEKEPWAIRKPRYIHRLTDAPPVALEVSVADKVHNAEAILDDYDRLGPDAWNVFREKRPEYQLWYYTSLVDVFRQRGVGRLAEELERVVSEVARASGRHRSSPAGSCARPGRSGGASSSPPGQ